MKWDIIIIGLGKMIVIRRCDSLAKEFEELTIVDNFMFGAVMRDPKRCKPLLEYILGVKIRKIEYPELQKSIDMQYQSKSIRLDVYVEDDKKSVYNIEMQTTRYKNLPKRIRILNLKMKQQKSLLMQREA